MVLLSPGVGTVEVTTDLDFEERVIMAFPSLIFCPHKGLGTAGFP